MSLFPKLYCLVVNLNVWSMSLESLALSRDNIQTKILRQENLINLMAQENQHLLNILNPNLPCGVVPNPSNNVIPHFSPDSTKD